MLGCFLEKKGYICYVFYYKGYGVVFEEFVYIGLKDWWKDVMDGYEFLKSKGYESIVVVGFLLGGVFLLKLGYIVFIKGIVFMCVFMYIKSEEVMYEGVLVYVCEYKKCEGKLFE